MCSSWHVSTLNKESSAFCPKKFGRVAQTALYVSIGTFRRKTLFWKKLEVSKISEIEWNFLSNLPETTSLWLSKLNSTCPWNILEQNNFFLKKTKFTEHVLYIEQKIQFVPTQFLRGCRNRFVCFNWNISKKNIFLKNISGFFYPFGLWVRNLWPNTKKKSMRLSKPHFTCLWDQCRGRHFLIEILSFYDNRILIQNTFSLLLTNSLRSLQSRIFCFHMNFLMKNILLERILGFINIFWNWVKNYWPSAKRFSIGLTKFGSTCPKEHSESKKVVLENVQF